VQPGTSIGQHVILNTAATVDHDSIVEDFVHIGPGCNLAGNVAVGEGTFFGIGSRAVPGCRVGPWTTVGAGAAVVHDLPANVTAGGVPAKVIKHHELDWQLN
jgi:acetyltransferase-like isoleucine patch superfamily enzyme